MINIASFYTLLSANNCPRYSYWFLLYYAVLIVASLYRCTSASLWDWSYISFHCLVRLFLGREGLAVGLCCYYSFVLHSTSMWDWGSFVLLLCESSPCSEVYIPYGQKSNRREPEICKYNLSKISKEIRGRTRTPEFYPLPYSNCQYRSLLISLKSLLTILAHSKARRDHCNLNSFTKQDTEFLQEFFFIKTISSDYLFRKLSNLVLVS